MSSRNDPGVLGWLGIAGLAGLVSLAACVSRHAESFAEKRSQTSEADQNDSQLQNIEGWLDVRRLYPSPLRTNYFSFVYPDMVLYGSKPHEIQLNKTSWRVPTVSVRTARILLADYELIRSDFPETQSWSQKKIDRWLIRQAGQFTQGHMLYNSAFGSPPKEIINTNVPYSRKEDLGTYGKPNTCKGFRPPRYGRALLFVLDPETPGICLDNGKNMRFADVKGVGLTTAKFRYVKNKKEVVGVPQNEEHATGLLETHTALREFVFEKSMAHLLDRSGIMASTLGTYAVLDWGFYMIDIYGKRSHAGAIIRRPNFRAAGRSDAKRLDLQNLRLELEKHFRSYGVTSSGQFIALRESQQPLPDSPPCHGLKFEDRQEILNCDLINLQFTRRGELVDFGSFTVMDRFEFPMRLHGYGGTIVVEPGNEDFVQRGERALPLSIWGPSDTEKPNPIFDRISVRFWELLHKEFPDFHWDVDYEKQILETARFEDWKTIDWKEDEARQRQYDAVVARLRARVEELAREYVDTAIAAIAPSQETP